MACRACTHKHAVDLCGRPGHERDFARAPRAANELHGAVVDVPSQLLPAQPLLVAGAWPRLPDRGGAVVPGRSIPLRAEPREHRVRRRRSAPQPTGLPRRLLPADNGRPAFVLHPDERRRTDPRRPHDRRTPHGWRTHHDHEFGHPRKGLPSREQSIDGRRSHGVERHGAAQLCSICHWLRHAAHPPGD